MIMLYQYRIHSTIVMNIFSEVWIHKSYTKNEKIYENNKKGIPSVDIRKRSSENNSIFWHLQLSAQPYFSGQSKLRGSFRYFLTYKDPDLPDLQIHLVNLQGLFLHRIQKYHQKLLHEGADHCKQNRAH